MEIFGCILPSYEKDFSRAQILVESFLKYCQDDTKLCIVVPDSDVTLFSQLRSEKVLLLTEPEIVVRYAIEEIHGARPGYINQELIKLAFWKTGIFENYLCLDSDGVFIRPFDRSDFMFSETEPFTVMFDDKELMCQPAYREMWMSREKLIREIYSIYEIPQPRYIRTCHGFQVFSRDVLIHMEENFLSPRNLDYLNLMEISPYEFSWYTLYLIRIGKKIHQTEHFFKLYHNSDQFLSDKIVGLDSKELSIGYVGLIVNSNFQPSNKQVSSYSSKLQVISYYLSPTELSLALLIKFKFFPYRVKWFIYKAIFQPLSRILPKNKLLRRLHLN